MTSRAPGETKRRLTSFYSFPQNLALYNFWMFHRAWKEINLSGLKVVLETNQLYISWGVKSMFLDPGVRSWIWSGEKQNMVQLKVAHNSKQLLGLELRYWKKYLRVPWPVVLFNTTALATKLFLYLHYFHTCIVFPWHSMYQKGKMVMRMMMWVIC